MSAEATVAFFKALRSRFFYTKALDSSTTTISPAERCNLLCNRAASWAELDLNRKVLADTAAALAIDGKCLRALLLKGAALEKMGRIDDARATWQIGASCESGDILLVAELAQRAAGGASSSPPPPAAAPAPAPIPPPAPSPPPAPAPAPSPAPAPTVASTVASHMAKATDPVQALADAKVYQRAVACANRGENEQAIKLFTQFLSRDPSSVQAYAGRGTAYAYSGDLHKALSDFNAAGKLQPADADILSRRVQVLSALERWDEVIVATTSLLKLEPREPAALHVRGKAYHTKQNYKRAVSDFYALLKLGEGGVKVYAPCATYNLLGTSLAAMGRCSEAIDAYTKTLEADPSLYQVHVNLGQAHRDLAQVVEAETHFSRAVSMKTDFVPGRHRRSLLRHAVGDHKGAIEDLLIVCKLEPTNHEAWDLLGMSYAALGQFATALQQFDELFKLEPSHWGGHHRAFLSLLLKHLDKKRDDHPLDGLVPADIKHGACKLLSTSVQTAAGMAAKAANATGSAKTAVNLQAAGLPPPSGAMATLLKAALPFGDRMQVRAKGFVPNGRLKRQAGLAVLQVAQRVRSVLFESGGGSSSSSDGSVSGVDRALQWAGVLCTTLPCAGARLASHLITSGGLMVCQESTSRRASARIPLY